MANRIVEFDGDRHAERDLALLWCNAPQGERQRITEAASSAEAHLKQDAEDGIPLTNGVHPVVRYINWDILRVFYQIYEAENKVIIIGFKSLL